MQRSVGSDVSLYAAHGGLGGKVRSFSPFGAVDRGPPQASLSLAVGFDHNCALSVSGAAYCWGSNGGGQLGNGTTTPSLVPVAVSGGLQFAAIAAGSSSTCALTAKGVVYCWGRNFLGFSSTTPVPLASDAQFVFISMSSTHACALTSGGTASCMGSNRGGALGTGDTISSATPVAVRGGLTFKTISAGLVHTCAVATDGTGYCWGPNTFSELGNGDSNTQSVALVPTAVVGGLTFASLRAGSTISCGVTTADTYCWGTGIFGSLGDGSTDAISSTPRKVVGGVAFVSVQPSTANDVRALAACALTITGSAYCWGSNYSGQLGTTSTLSTCTFDMSFGCTGTPVPVAGGLTFDIAIPGDLHTCGLARDGRAYCWGANDAGQLGTGGTTPSSTPTPVAGGIIFP